MRVNQREESFRGSQKERKRTPKHGIQVLGVLCSQKRKLLAQTMLRASG